MRLFFWRWIIGRRFKAIDGILHTRRNWLDSYQMVRIKRVDSEPMIFWSKQVEDDFVAALLEQKSNQANDPAL